MAKIFVSYSRADSQFVEQFVSIVRTSFRGKATVWIDSEIHGGADWWQMILSEIANADLFIYLISNESLESTYCQAEMREALRLRKLILPVVIRRTDFAKAPDDLRQLILKTQYLDFVRGTKDTTATVNLFAAIRTLLEDVPENPLPPSAPTPIDEPPVRDKPQVSSSARKLPIWSMAAGIAVILVMLFAFYMLVLQDENGNETATPTTESSLQTEAATEVAVVLTETPTQEPTPTNTEPPTATLSETDVEGTIQAEMLLIGTEAKQTIDAQETLTAVFATSAAQSTIYANETEIAHATETATLFTLTPTIDTRATAEARSTQAVIETATVQAYETATQAAVNDTATATLWTNTPTATFTPSNTPTLTQGEIARQVAEVGVSSNADWTPYGEGSGGVEMVLVPKGCFMMGSDEGEDDESPAHEQCLDAPFWIDKTEVTRSMYQECVDAGVCASTPANEYSTSTRQPINRITWFQARDYCEWRGARLPTEKEWEYAARGPDNLVYPWGNDFVAANVVYGDNAGGETAEVGSRPGGASWVGALDMSGNVWEWVSTIYQDYPYSGTDGGESNSDDNSVRVVRGGSWNLNDNYMRSAFRDRNSPDFGNLNFGFRCALSY